MTDAMRIHEFVTPQKRGVVALTPALRNRLHLDEPGAQLEFIEEDDGTIIVRGVLPVSVDQRWFWTDRWQAMEREADADIAAGRTTVYSSIDEMFADLDA